MKIGVNTFGLGPYLNRNETEIWNGLLEAGVTAIEPCIAFHPRQLHTKEEQEQWNRGRFAGEYAAALAEEKIRSLREMGFEVYSFQLQAPVLTAEAIDEAIPFMERNGLHYCIFSFMERSVAKIRLQEDAFRRAVTTLRSHGMEFLGHNHDMEWLPDEGTSVMQWLLDHIPELRFEIDLGWTEYAGVSSADILRKYPDRFPLLHFKEIARGGKAWTDKPFCTAPGEGILPLKELLEIAGTMPVDDRAFIIDQDDSVNGDIVKDIAKGIRTIRSLRPETTGR